MKLYVEIPVMLLFFVFNASDTVTSNFILLRTCTVTLGYNETICRRLIMNTTSNSSNSLEDIVQIQANYVLTTLSIIQNIIPCILCLFLGPWSDKNGRKPCMILSLSAYFVTYILLAIISCLSFLSPWVLVVSTVVSVATGGFASFFASVLCFITDISSEENRGMKMGILEGSMAIGLLSGSMSSSYLFNFVGFLGVYLMSAGCMLVSLVYVIFVIPETVQSQNDFKAKIKDLFHFKHITLMMKTTFKKREHYGRPILLSIFLILVLNVLNIASEGSVLYLYVRNKFHWDLKHYTLYSAGKSICLVFGGILGIYVLNKRLKIQDLTLVIIGFISMITSLIIQGLATQEWHMYLSAAARSLGSVLTPMLRSFMSKIIPLEDVGKIFPLTVAGESSAVLIGSPIFTAIYDLTIRSFPGAFSLFTAGVNSINLTLTIFIIFLRRYHPHYSSMTSIESSNNT